MDVTPFRKTLREMIKAVTLMSGALLVCMAAAVLTDANLEQVSRRFANLSFVLWNVRDDLQIRMLVALPP